MSFEGTHEEFDAILETLCPSDRDKFILANWDFVVRKEEDKLLLDAELTANDLIDSQTYVGGYFLEACCEAPDYVIDENNHDQICRNCAVARNCGIITVGRVKHMETLDCLAIVHQVFYKRITHFKRLLRDIQGAWVPIPPAIIADVRRHVMCPPTTKGVLLYLKQKRYMRYYGQARFIAKCLGDNSASPTINDADMRLLSNAFLKKSTAFDRFKRSKEGVACGRKNFLSYNFILQKLCEENGLYHLTAFLSPLKCFKTRNAQQEIWERLPFYY